MTARRRPALWAVYLVAGALLGALYLIAYLLFMGPVEVLVPYVVKHDLRGAASDLGLVFGAGGLASILCAGYIHSIVRRGMAVEPEPDGDEVRIREVDRLQPVTALYTGASSTSSGL